MVLYKRNAKGDPIFWEIKGVGSNIIINYGLVGKEGRSEQIKVTKDTIQETMSLVKSRIKAKRKEGYKELRDLYDNAPNFIEGTNNLLTYLITYLPKNNTHEDGNFIPMLCKTLEDNKPFEKGSYFGQWKINGERCIITAYKDNSLFGDIHLNYRSREGIDWTSKLNYLDDILLPCIPQDIIDMMIEEGVGLDGELYLPGYGINEINSFIKNTELPQHYKLQFWLYDICVENMSAKKRQYHIDDFLLGDKLHRSKINSLEEHLNNTDRFVVLPNYDCSDINSAIAERDLFISLGFEGLVIRKSDAEYQFGGRRNNSMLKFKKKLDGLFTIIDIVPEGIKRSNLGKFILKNDINDETFDCSYNATHSQQEEILINKNNYIGKKCLVEYRERSGIKQCPFHARAISIK